jgi:hypothetical protein
VIVAVCETMFIEKAATRTCAVTYAGWLIDWGQWRWASWPI